MLLVDRGIEVPIPLDFGQTGRVLYSPMTDQLQWDETFCRRYSDGMRKLAPYDHRGVAERIAKHLGGLRSEAALVDVASGPGFLGLALAKILGIARLTLVDSASAMLAIAQNEGQKVGVSLEILESSAESIGLPDGSADVVTCKNLMNCLDVAERVPVALELFRLLPPGGKVFIVDFDAGGSRLAAKLIGVLVRMLAGGEFARDFRDAVGRRFDPRPIADALAQAGATISVERFGPSFLLIATRPL